MADIYVNPTLYTNKPEPDGRLIKEMKVYDLLEQLKIPFLRADHEAAKTIESCEAVEALFGIEICKNLFLCNTQKTNFYLLILPGSKKFKTGEVSKQLNVPRLSFAPANYMEDFLDITPGSVSILGLMNDKENHVQLLIDEDILHQESIGCHPCINTSSLKIQLKDIMERFLPHIKHDPIIVRLSE